MPRFLKPHLWWRATISLTLLLVLNLLIAAFSPAIASAANPPELLAVKNGSLVILNTAGAVQRTLYSASAVTGGAQWSPDGSKIAFTINSQLSVINADGSGYKKLTDASSNPYASFYFDWSPDSKQIIYSLGYDGSSPSVPIFQINADATNNKKLLDINTSYPAGLIGYWPDGKKILYQQDLEYGLGAASQVILCNLDGSNKTKLFDVTNFYVSVETSPDRSQVLFSELGFAGAVASVADPVGTARKLDLGFYSYPLAWSNAAGKIVMMTPQDSNSGSPSPYLIEEVDLATKARRKIATTPPLRPFQGEGSSVNNLVVDSAGFAAFTNRANSYIIDFSNGQVRDIGDVGIAGWRPGPTSYGNILPDFYQIWRKADEAVATGAASRSWLWGPDAFATKTEEYKEAKGGQRQVQYFDKARMELNNPDGDRSNPFFVTNGLLPKELISGQLQTGDSSYVAKAPAEVNVAGDPNGSITYAKLAGVTSLDNGQNTAPNRVGQNVTATIERNGSVGEGAALAGVTNSQYIPETSHNIPNVFADYFKTLPQDWVFVMGYPLSEAYQTQITLNGQTVTALVQVYERRVLTYTPSNPKAFQVEQGNVGQHYYQWRYGN